MRGFVGSSTREVEYEEIFCYRINSIRTVTCILYIVRSCCVQGGGVRGDLLLRYQQYRDPEGPLRIRARGSRYVVLYSVQ